MTIETEMNGIDNTTQHLICLYQHESTKTIAVYWFDETIFLENMKEWKLIKVIDARRFVEQIIRYDLKLIDKICKKI
jgi:hypothetical protein